ncbi:MAG: xanthine dehydrogenase family protein molybdopterin-binding subunit [Oceanospirillaceae bacterium]|jgi:isoquinoline 1-oxidoreductase beta subunit|nr:xanthine dehydrogenase family protein molybdopterin-binding subunit [Oceanospirillaceae bacterium]MBT4443114.1 xanthine dehydrogenase family protein molybdopterin-binding subunit [Oceanospirillaceae bacterium]MBT7330524.1 xanthine dehydrogenase family protein molybdopterin-binding subunit [Oceanospirillaceae bacterium]
MKATLLTRRHFLKNSAAFGVSGLLIGCSNINTEVELLHSNTPPTDEMHNWLFIGTDNRIIVTVPCAEMGQGVNTSLAQLVADELDADWHTLEIRQAPLNSKFNNAMGMQLTGGSTAVRDYYLTMRKVGAGARSIIIKAAAAQLGTTVANLSTQDSHVIYQGKAFPYGQFASDAATWPVPDDVPLKSNDQLNLIGKSLPQIDTHNRITGKAIYGIDVQVPNMLNAAIVQAPIFGSKVKTYNETAALQVTGVKRVLPIEGALVVVAEKYWQAKKGAAALQASFSDYDKSIAGFNTKEVHKAYSDALDEQGKATPNTPYVLDVEYSVPWLAHATMEPMNCTAWVQDDRVDLWLPTQSQTATAKTAADITGLETQQIHVHNQLLGGGFGRRGETDFVAQAVQISMMMKQPIKLIWSREEDMQHDFYRPMVISRFQIGLDAQFKPIAWHNQFASSSVFERVISGTLPSALKWIPVTAFIGDPIIAQGATEIPYLPEGIEADTHLSLVESNIPVGFWRSVGHSSNAFFTESVIDEAAQLAQQDSYEYRRNLLTSSPRERAVLNKAAKLGKWDKAKTGHFQGIAVEYGFESYAAMVVELSVDNNIVTVHKVTCAVDCGKIVNPNGAIAQIEGGINFAISAAMYGEISIEKGRVKQSNFHDYLIMRLNNAPVIEVHLIPSDEAPTGVGEVGVPPLAPAMANALVAAGQPRIRHLPFGKSGLRLA